MGRSGGLPDGHGNRFSPFGRAADLKGDLGRGAELLADCREIWPDARSGH